uniref:Uncharacterized protein n=1 Tax=Avena sativa TaxID=4498 RepID=A0ACD5ZML1_AVESA
MAGKNIASKATAQPKSVGRRLWRLTRAVLYMLRRGVLPSGRKVATDLCLLLRRGKIAGKPSEVEFSFSARSAKRRGGNRRQCEDEAANDYNYNAADIAMVFEMLSDCGDLFADDDDALALALATPSPQPWSSSPAFGRSPAAGEQQVDRKADEFIRRFYEQLRAQKSVSATPDYNGYAGGTYDVEHAPRPVAAGIA